MSGKGDRNRSACRAFWGASYWDEPDEVEQDDSDVISCEACNGMMDVDEAMGGTVETRCAACRKDGSDAVADEKNSTKISQERKEKE